MPDATRVVPFEAAVGWNDQLGWQRLCLGRPRSKAQGSDVTSHAWYSLSSDRDAV